MRIGPVSISVVVMGGKVMVLEPEVTVDAGKVVVVGFLVGRETEMVGWGCIVTGWGVGKKMGGIVDVVVVGEPDGETGVPLEYSGIGEGGAVATLERRVIWVGGGLTLCTGLKTAVVGSPTLTVTGHQSMAVVVMAGMEMVVVIVWVSPPAADDSSVVVSGGHEMVVVEPSCDGGSTSVHGGMHEAVAPPPGAQMLVGT